MSTIILFSEYNVRANCAWQTQAHQEDSGMSLYRFLIGGANYSTWCLFFHQSKRAGTPAPGEEDGRASTVAVGKSGECRTRRLAEKLHVKSQGGPPLPSWK